MFAKLSTFLFTKPQTLGPFNHARWNNVSKNFRAHPKRCVTTEGKIVANIKGVHTYTLRKTINASLNNTYHVISEVSKYKEFLPYCTESWVSKRDPSNEDKPMQGGLRVGYKQYDENFDCLIQCLKSSDNSLERTVIAESLPDQLFDKLHTKWIIVENDQKKCEVELRLDFKFKSRFYNSISSLFAKTLTDVVMKAFTRQIAHVQKEYYLKQKTTA